MRIERNIEVIAYQTNPANIYMLLLSSIILHYHSIFHSYLTVEIYHALSIRLQLCWSLSLFSVYIKRVKQYNLSLISITDKITTKFAYVLSYFLSPEQSGNLLDNRQY